ncbi:hypothetical protein [Halorussus sp. AFM4]|uniref:hypothetical protein n=1 Tax=Halorussus sp. AFM4 TaxID=3421651 RepID=UPI003EB7063F
MDVYREDTAEKRINEIREIGSEAEDRIPHGTIEELVSGPFKAEEYASVLYGHGGSAAVLFPVFNELDDLEHDTEVLANKSGVRERVEVLDEVHHEVQSIRHLLLGLGMETVPGVGADSEGQENSQSFQALLSDAERGIIRGELDADKSAQRRTANRVRRRIQDRLPEDIDVLREEQPELFDELKELVLDEMTRGWSVNDFDIGDEVRHRDGSVWTIERIIAGNTSFKLEIEQGRGDTYQRKTVSSDKIVERV